MGIKEMQGTPAHLEYIGPEGRKRRSKCGYYVNGVCYCKKSQSFLVRCVGRLCCQHYTDSYKVRLLYEEKRKSSQEKNKNNNADIKCKSSKSSKNKIGQRKGKKSARNNKEYIRKLNEEHPLLNKTIILKSEQTGKEIIIKIVPESEENPFRKLLSGKSIIGKAIINKVVGDKFKVTLGNDEIEFKVLEIK